MSRPVVLIMAAGTGGHIFPALTIARRLQADGVQVEWLGTPAGMENDVLKDTGIPLNRLSVSGLRGKGGAALLKAPFMLLRSIWQALAVVRAVRPCCVLGMGGYVTGPGGIAAWLLRRPLLIHEQNAVAGTSNRLLKPFARRVLQAFPGTFAPSHKVIATGNPVRSDITALSTQHKTAYDGERPLRVLVLGGSLGAAAINQVVPAMLASTRLPAGQMVEVWHQSGRGKDAETIALYQSFALDVPGTHKVMPFISDMAAAYQWADLVICRAGAGTLAEIAVAGLPSILVPYPHAIDDHQTANARWLSEAGAALVVPQTALDADKLATQLAQWIEQPEMLRQMAQAARSQAVPDAGDKVSAICVEICHD